MGIIGILVSIALPQFSGLQGKGFDARVRNDTRLAAAAQEAYFADTLSYSSSCTSLPGFSASPGVVFTTCAGDAISFQMALEHPNSNDECTFDSLGDPTMTCGPK